MCLSGWAQLVDLFGSLPQCHRTGYMELLQLSCFLHSLPDPACFTRHLTPFEDLYFSEGPIRKSLSFSYHILLNFFSQQDSPYPSKWERDLNTTFTDNQKNRIFFFAHKSSLCSQYQKTTYKILSQWYRTPSVLASMFPGHSPSCWRSGAQVDTIFHIFCDCPNIQLFW